ncbi:hypothetical protein QQF64_034023 [Cirrhinus molitorella]|uniref:Uncharacterized protein n=1 Tax=Cirrhinus molitorella TaxID=172907 RepID=A0ABR3MVT9_9TELE
MNEKEESDTLHMADMDEDPPYLAVVEGPQSPTINVEQQPGKSSVEEELQSERRKRIQLEMKLYCSTAEILRTSCKDKVTVLAGILHLSLVKVFFGWRQDCQIKIPSVLSVNMLLALRI